MKHLYLLTLLAAALAFTGCQKDDSVPAQPVTSDFDPVFARVLQEKGYISDANNITTDDLAAITELDVWGEGDNPGPITSLRGIEHFKSLTELDCSNNQLTTLDVSQNPALTELYCGSNELTELHVNPALMKLYCEYNQLTELNISQSPALTELDCSSNQLTTLDVSQNTVLTDLICDNNPLTTLDVSKNAELLYVSCSDCQLTALDLSHNTQLGTLWSNSNPLKTLDLSKTQVWGSCPVSPTD